MAELKVSKSGAVATVVFSNLPKMNAMSFDMWSAVPKAIAELDADPAVRVIVCKGDGDKAFISGADISQFEKLRGTADAQAEYNRAVEQAYNAPLKAQKPVIASIRGICIGGGWASPPPSTRGSPPTARWFACLPPARGLASAPPAGRA